MALVHKFSINYQNSDPKYIIDLPDNLFQYLGDSLQWINVSAQ